MFRIFVSSFSFCVIPKYNTNIILSKLFYYISLVIKEIIKEFNKDNYLKEISLLYVDIDTSINKNLTEYLNLLSKYKTYDLVFGSNLYLNKKIDVCSCLIYIPHINLSSKDKTISEKSNKVLAFLDKWYRHIKGNRNQLALNKVIKKNINLSWSTFNIKDFPNGKYIDMNYNDKNLLNNAYWIHANFRPQSEKIPFLKNYSGWYL
ncbi:MAG: hypothetical protein GY830_04635 [Bacteroidetes bacterium]|nr:hypothetical protein [Bacteroidota bacterium]